MDLSMLDVGVQEYIKTFNASRDKQCPWYVDLHVACVHRVVFSPEEIRDMSDEDLEYYATHVTHHRIEAEVLKRRHNYNEELIGNFKNVCTSEKLLWPQDRKVFSEYYPLLKVMKYVDGDYLNSLLDDGQRRSICACLMVREAYRICIDIVNRMDMTDDLTRIIMKEIYEDLVDLRIQHTMNTSRLMKVVDILYQFSI